MNTEVDFEAVHVGLYQIHTPISYHVVARPRNGAQLSREALTEVQQRVWRALFDEFGSENAVVTAHRSETAEGRARWDQALGLAFTAGRAGLPAGAEVQLRVGIHHNF
jgi:hypothetical protein